MRVVVVESAPCPSLRQVPSASEDDFFRRNFCKNLSKMGDQEPGYYDDQDKFEGEIEPEGGQGEKLPPVPPPKKKCCNKICDPSPAAYKLEYQKARLRSLDSRHPTHYLREWSYQKHLKALESVTPLVNTSSPLVPKGVMHNIFRDNRAGICHAKIEFDNTRLLHSLASIYNGSWKTGLQNKLERPPPIRNRTYERTVKTMNLMQENIKKFGYIQQTKPVYSRVAFAKWHEQQRKHKDRITKFPDIMKPGACYLPFRKVMAKSAQNPIQYAYLLVEVEDKMAENIVFELYSDLCPFTVKNFQKLCTNTKATGCDCRTYRCKKIDRLHCVQVVQGEFRKVYWVVAENVDSTVEYVQMMMKEDSTISHTEAGLVTRPKHRAGGVFFITIGPCPHLDDFCYVFGKVTDSSLDYLKQLEEKNIEDNGQPILNMHITDCGVVDSPGDCPPPMLLQDFIAQVRLEIMPFIRRNPENPEEWAGGKTAFASYLKDRANEDRQRFNETLIEGREYATGEVAD